MFENKLPGGNKINETASLPLRQNEGNELSQFNI
jgi:hypothetical protein